MIVFEIYIKRALPFDLYIFYYWYSIILITNININFLDLPYCPRTLLWQQSYRMNNQQRKNVLTVVIITQCCLCKKSKRIPSDHSSCRIRSLKANKRDYAVDKLGDDRSAYHSGNESVLANGRVGAVPLLSASTSACGRGCFSETRVALPAVAPKIT